MKAMFTQLLKKKKMKIKLTILITPKWQSPLQKSQGSIFNMCFPAYKLFALAIPTIKIQGSFSAYKKVFISLNLRSPITRQAKSHKLKQVMGEISLSHLIGSFPNTNCS